MEPIQISGLTSFVRFLTEFEKVAGIGVGTSEHDEYLKHTKNVMGVVVDMCNELDLPVTRAQAERVIQAVDNDTRGVKLENLVNEVYRRFEDEIKSIRAVVLSQARSVLYDANQLFGETVEDQFPEVSEDIAEAGRCFALGRYTACVFHLMRVTEAGTQWLGTKLGVADPHAKAWGSILSEADAKVKAMPKGAEQTAYSAVMAHLHNVKNAWRNPTMHITRHYVIEDMKAIFTHTESFMNTLAEVKLGKF